MKTTIEQLVEITQEAVDMAIIHERQKCVEDVCMYCGGRAPQWRRYVEGPNDAGNYTHKAISGGDGQVLCYASSIFSRARFEKATKRKERT